MARALFIASLAIAMLGCADTCARGPTTSCWCPGDNVGVSTCGQDGRYGACACPGAVAPVVSAAPPPPPPTLRPVLLPTPTGFELPPTAPVSGVAADATLAGWLAGPVRGHDNRVAAMRRVSIRGTPGAYTITIDNQFGLHCDLDFDGSGMPSQLRDCRAHEPGWGAAPSRIAMTCAHDGFDLACQAPYELHGPNGYSTREIIVIRRRED